MRIAPIMLAAFAALGLSGCAVVGAATSVTGSVISTTVDVTGDVIGAAARTVTGGSSDRDSDSK